jgi:hypothetical protein
MASEKPRLADSGETSWGQPLSTIVVSDMLMVLDQTLML